MSDVKYKPEGQVNVLPHLCIKGAAKAIEFYQAVFDAQVMSKHSGPDGERVMHAAIRIGDAPLFLADDFPEFTGGKESHPLALGGSGVTIHVWTPDPDGIMEKAVKHGATTVMPVDDMFWGHRYGVFVDPWGHQWSIAKLLKELSEEELKAAAAEAFSGGDCH